MSNTSFGVRMLIPEKHVWGPKKFLLPMTLPTHSGRSRVAAFSTVSQRSLETVVVLLATVLHRLGPPAGRGPRDPTFSHAVTGADPKSLSTLRYRSTTSYH